jgi:hypothetical protein
VHENLRRRTSSHHDGSGLLTRHASVVHTAWYAFHYSKRSKCLAVSHYLDKNPNNNRYQDYYTGQFREKPTMQYESLKVFLSLLHFMFEVTIGPDRVLLPFPYEGLSNHLHWNLPEARWHQVRRTKVSCCTSQYDQKPSRARHQTTWVGWGSQT